jgi:hypothetical protein
MEGRRFRAYGYCVRAHAVGAGKLKRLISLVRQFLNVADHALTGNACTLGMYVSIDGSSSY